MTWYLFNIFIYLNNGSPNLQRQGNKYTLIWQNDASRASSRSGMFSWEMAFCAFWNRTLDRTSILNNANLRKTKFTLEHSLWATHTESDLGYYNYGQLMVSVMS